MATHAAEGGARDASTAPMEHRNRSLSSSTTPSLDTTATSTFTTSSSSTDDAGGADDPRRQARLLVQKALLACFADALAPTERAQLLRDAGRITRSFAQQLLLAPPDASHGDQTDRNDDAFALPSTTVAPPRAYFLFRENGRMHLPTIDWSAFRGYSVALWVNVAFLQSTAPDGAASCSLFRFTNASSSLGVEAMLSLDPDRPSDSRQQRVLLTVSSCHPSDATKRSPSAAVQNAPPTASPTFTTDWRRIQHPIQLVPGQWHLLVLTHSLHYVRKSKVACYVDTTVQFQDELVYPSGLVTASKCTLGGGAGTTMQLASATMFQDELAREMVTLLHAQGPRISSFNRCATPAPTVAVDNVFGDVDSVAAAASPLAVPYSDLFAAYSKLHVVFCYSAHDLAHADYAGLGVAWLSEGTVSDSTARWVAMESTTGVSAEIQQRHARLGKRVEKVVFADSEAAWYSVLGVTSVPALLHYLLTGYERVYSASEVLWTGQQGDSTSDLSAVLEHILVDVMWIVKGLLLNSVRNQQDALQHYVLHVLYHVLVKHELRLRSVWTPRSLLVCVEMVESLHAMLPSRQRELLSANHPLQESIWTTNPLFASGVRALLLDYRLWASTDFKTQSIFNHQLYSLVCAHPRLFNDLQAVPKVLEILREFYSSTTLSGGDKRPLSQQQQQQQPVSSSDKRKDDEWKQHCVHTLVEIIEVCLTNQSVFVHDVKDEELMETTFARPAAVTPSSSGGGTTSGAAAAASGYAPFALSRQHGGVFSINLDNIVWSDQTDARTDDSEQVAVFPPTSAPAPAPTVVQVRFSLVRNVRAVVRFLLTSDDAAVSRSVLLLLRRLAVSFLDMRFALLSSNILDCLLFLMRPPVSDDDDAHRRPSPIQTGGADAQLSVAMACVPLFIYLVDWLESIEGRTVWCGLEEHLRLILNGDGTFSLGFLELMMEFYFHPPVLLGVQQSVIMNDPSKRDSVLFPIAASASKAAATSSHESGIVVADDGGLASASAGNSTDLSGSINGIDEWVHLASQFSGKRLSLSWEKRLAVVKLAALRNIVLSASRAEDAQTDGRSRSSSSSSASTLVADMFDEGVSGILSLPLRGVLPYLPVLLGKGSASFREKVLMDINVKLKTDEVAQQQLLLMKREWAEALLELSIACSCQVDDAPSLDAVVAQEPGQEDDGSRDSRTYGRAYSFDASKTGEDLVLDTIVSLLCVAMHNLRGWRSFTDLILALQSIRIKYDQQLAGHVASSAPVLSAPERVGQSELYCESLDWLSRVAGIVLQRMARSRTILSRALAENLQKLLYLVHETLLAQPLRQSATAARTAQPTASAAPSTSGLVGWKWSDAQLFLLNAVLDMCARLIQSTHKLHRIGLQPGLQILQRALPFVVGSEMMERVIGVLVAFFQQEMGVVAALRVYDHIPTRDVFLSAMVCLRRALLVQDDDAVLALLRVLVLRITTSGSFVDELHAAGVTVQALGLMSEANATLVSLDALALAINETEMHEREEEADFVPHFPAAKDLRNERRRASLYGASSSSANDSALEYQTQFVDEAEQLLWAALEVEENRTMASLRDLATRDRHHVRQNADVRALRKRAWTETLWVKHEVAFRSQHQFSALATAAPDVLRALRSRQVFRIGLYETPHPGRMRRTLEVDLSTARIVDADAESVHDSGKAVESEAAVVVGAVRRRQFSLPLEFAHGLDYEVAHQSPLASPTSRVNGSLLERVGRVVAEQRGGEIQDITSDASESEPSKTLDGDDHHANDSMDDGGAKTSTDSPNEPSGVSLQLAYNQHTSAAATADDEEKPPMMPPSVETSPWNQRVAALPMLKPLRSQFDAEQECESGLDPGEGVAIVADDQLVARAVCRRVVPEGVVSGMLYLCHETLSFEPTPPLPTSVSSEVGGAESSTTNTSSADEAAPGLHRCWRWPYHHIVAVYLRRYRLRDSAIEIFLRNGSNHFLDFPLAARHQRNELVRLLYSFLPRSVPKQWPGRGVPNLSATTKAWQSRQISNFEYLMALNTFAGRSFNDLTQYPVFPWVLSNYESETLDLSDPHNFRDLSKPMGALNPTRLDEYWERYNSFDDPVIPKFLYGSHYSTCAGVVLFFLFRLQPFAELQRRMQGGSFDLPDRLFYSIKETWDMCNSQMSEVKELTPEFYCDANFLRNVNRFALGKRHDQQVVNDVQLPPWAATPEEFVRINRAALESELVSQHLHEWIDLVFGFKQRGKAALKAHNVFYYLTYYGVVDLDRIDDPFLKESMELQIAHFGQCPMQLFGAPHPKRSTVAFTRRSLALTPRGAAAAAAASSTGGSASGSGAGKAGLASGVTSPITPGSARTPGGSGTATNVARPLSLSFQDFSLTAQEKRRHWSASVDVKPVVQCAVRLIKILPDRIVTVNELGVVDMYNWKLVPKPQPQPPARAAAPPTTLSMSGGHEAPGYDDAVGVGGHVSPTGSSVTGAVVVDDTSSATPKIDRAFFPESPTARTPVGTPHTEVGSPSAAGNAPSSSDESAMKPPLPQCPWLVEVFHEDSPFDFIPRIPFHEDAPASSSSDATASFPVAFSSNGRVLISGGGRGGMLHLRLVDLDSGQIVGKASVTGHTDAVTCLSLDRLTYSTASTQPDEEELVVSGSNDGTLALWRLSRVKQDLLFRLPRVSSSPILVLRGHSAAVRDCCVSTFLGLVVSCSERVGVVHYLHGEGQVAFEFEPPSGLSGDKAVLCKVRLSRKGYILALSRVSPSTASGSRLCTSVCQVFNLSGVLLHSHSFDADDIRDVTLSAEGDLVFLVVAPKTLRICRLDDFVVVQEYVSPEHVVSPVSATCFGPSEAVILIASGHSDGTLVLQLLPDADGSVSFLASVRKMLGVSSKLKMVKGTVQQAQNLAMTTLGSAKAVTSTARDIAGEALGEAKSMVRGFFTYLQRQNQG